MSHKSAQDKLKPEYPWTTRQKRGARGAAKRDRKMRAAAKAKQR